MEPNRRADLEHVSNVLRSLSLFAVCLYNIFLTIFFISYVYCLSIYKIMINIKTNDLKFFFNVLKNVNNN